jgi:hypothetical protein
LRQAAAFCLSQKMGCRRQASNRFFATDFCDTQALVFVVQKPVAKLTFCATSGKKIGGSLEVYIILSTVWLLRSAGSLAKARTSF